MYSNSAEIKKIEAGDKPRNDIARNISAFTKSIFIF